MITRQKLVAGLGGLTLMLGTVGGAVAVHAASPPATAPPAVVQPAQPSTNNAQDQQDSQVEDGATDTAADSNVPDTDNVQDGSDSQDDDGTPDVPGAVTP